METKSKEIKVKIQDLIKEIMFKAAEEGNSPE